MIKQMKFYLLALLTVVVVSSCSVISSMKGDPMMKIQSGMTKEQITKMMGKPDTRSFDGDSEVWQYIAKKDGRIIEIGFNNNVVDKMNSYYPREKERAIINNQ